MKKPSRIERKLDRELEKYSRAEVSSVRVGAWAEAKESFLGHGFKEKDGYLVQKKLSFWKTVSCDCVMHVETEDVLQGLHRAYERSKHIKELNFDTFGGTCFISLLFKEQVTQEELQSLVRVQASTIAVEGTIGMRQKGENQLFVLVDKSTGKGYFVDASPAVGAVYTHGCKVLYTVFGKQ